MRFRYFLIAFSVLTLVCVASTVLHGELLRRERSERVDVQLREAAAALLDSDINRVRHLSFERVDEILSEELGESRVGKFFLIHNQYTGEKVFESTAAKVLHLPAIPLEPQWLSFELNGKFVRVLNLKLPRIEGETLQVGLVLDESLVEPPLFSGTDVLRLIALVLFGLGMSWALSYWLMHPIRRLVEHVSAAAENPGAETPPPPRPRRFFRNGDEYAQLVESYGRLLSQVRRQQKLLRTWSFQMAHELKSPLAIMRAELSEAMGKHQMPDELALGLSRELLYASDTVTAFLSWAELDGEHATRQLFAVPAGKTLRKVGARLAEHHPGRIQILLRDADDFYVLAGLQHFEHLVSNLLQNALLYTKGAVKVTSPAPGQLRVTDEGPGIPAEVIARLGEPFNRGGRSAHEVGGHGLGLAYVQSVCQLHGWKLSLENLAVGAQATVTFPPCEARPEPAQRLTDTLPL